MKMFEVLMVGWVLDLRRHTVTEVRAAGFLSVFLTCALDTDEVGLKLAVWIVER